jgi:hypothetical protein
LFGNSAQSQEASAQAKLYKQEAQQQGAEFQPFMQQEGALSSFYTPYMSSGSPFLKNIQAASAAQNAQNYNTAAGTTRGQLMQSGMGFGPSGVTGATIGGLGAQQANNASSNYLQNLLNNENLKFQAASGLQQTANAMKPGTPATVGGAPVTSSLPGAIQGAGNSLAGAATLGALTGQFGGAPAASTPTTTGFSGGFPGI